MARQANNPGWPRILAAKALRVGSAGLVAGGAAGWIGLASGKTAEAAGAVAGRSAWLLVPALPLALLAISLGDLRQIPRAVRTPASARRVGALLSACALAGATVGTALFFVTATYVPTIFSRFQLDPIAVRQALVAHFDWRMAAAGLAATVVTAVVETLAVFR